MTESLANLPGGKLGLRRSERVTQMKHTVHVGERECSHETTGPKHSQRLLLLTHIIRRIHFKRLLLLPQSLHLGFIFQKVISSRKRLRLRQRTNTDFRSNLQNDARKATITCSIVNRFLAITAFKKVLPLFTNKEAIGIY